MAKEKLRSCWWPVVLHYVLTSIEILTDASGSFWNRCAIRIEPNKQRVRKHLDNCLMLVTAICYEKAAKTSLTAYREDLILRDAVLRLGFPLGERFDSWARPDEMMHLLRGVR